MGGMNKMHRKNWKTIAQERVHELFAEMLLQNEVSFVVWLIFFLIHYFQVLDFLFYHYYDALKAESIVASVIMEVLNYSSLRTFIPIQTLYITMLVACTALVLYQIIAFVYYYMAVYGSYKSCQKVVKISGLSLFFLLSQLINQVLFYPTTILYFGFFAQRHFISDSGDNVAPESELLDYGSILHIIVVIILAIIWLLSTMIQVINILFTTELSGQRLVQWSSVQPYPRLAFLLMKIVQALFVTVVNISFIVDHIIQIILSLLLIFLRMSEPLSTERKVYYIESFCDFFFIFMCFFTITTLYWEAIPCNFLFALAFAACFAYIYLCYLEYKYQQLIAIPYTIHIKQPIEAYNFLNAVELLLERRDDESRGMLAGIALNHNRICDNVTCWCQEVKNAMSSKGKDPDHHGALLELPGLSVDSEKSIEYQNKTKIGRWLLSLSSDIMMSQNNAMLNILISYIYYFYIGNMYQSLNYLDIAITHKPSFLQAFAIHIHRRRIEMTLLTDHEANLSSGILPIDIRNVLEFSQTYNSFLEILFDCANAYQTFWKELVKDCPNSTSLSDNGKDIAEKWTKIQSFFSRLLSLMPKNMNYLYLYGLFIKYITNDSEEAKKIHQKLVYIRNSKSHLKGPEFERFVEEGRSMMFRVSGCRDSIGKIIEVNIESEKILGYSRPELRNNKINKLMVRTISEVHDVFISKFYETLISNKVNHTTYQFIREKSGFFIPVQLLVRVVPSLVEGLEFCGLCYRNESNPYITAKTNKTRGRTGTILCDESFRVIGITRNCSRTLKIPDSFVNKGFPDNFVYVLFPLLRDENARNKLYESRGRVINYSAEKIYDLTLEEEEGKSPDNKHMKKDDILLWIRLVKEDYSDSKAIINMVLMDQVPNIDASNYISYEENGCQFFMNPSEGAGPKVASILPQIFRMNSEFEKKVKRAGTRNPFDYAESVFAESMLESLPSTASQSSSSIGTISKDITTFKERISENKEPNSVKRLRIIFLIFVFFVIGIVIAELIINLIVVDQFNQQFEFMRYLSQRYTTVMQATNRIRIFVSMLNNDTSKPDYNETHFNESKTYLQEYSEQIVKYHQKIVQLEEGLNFNDGAKSISLIYKSKYNENEESLINYSFAIMEFVVKILQLINYDSLNSATNILKTDTDKTSSYIRTRDFLLLNTNLTLRTYSEEIMEKYINMLNNKGQSGKILEIVLSSVSLGCIIILFFLILPVVFRVVSEKSKVMKGFAYVKKTEIQEILNWASAFDIRSSAKSLKLLAETRKEKVYEIMQMQKEKEIIKEEEKQESVPDEASKNNKLRDLIRNIFKFEEEDQDPENKKEDMDMIDNSFPSKLAYSGENQFSSFDIDHFTPEPPMPKIEEDYRENMQNEQASVIEPILKSEKDQTQQEEEEERIIYQQKKKALSQIDVSLRRRALIKCIS